ncbi:18133_t:CDS:2, partial [Cetraspora pellucida]
VGTYPVGHKNNVIKIVLFVLNNPDERDFKTQVIFERDGYYSIGGKIVLEIYESKKRPEITVSISTHVMILNKAPESNKYPLRISFIGVAQESPNVLKNDENAIFNIMINDYAEYNSFAEITCFYRWAIEKEEFLTTVSVIYQKSLMLLGQNFFLHIETLMKVKKCVRTEHSNELMNVFNDTDGKVNDLNKVAQNDCVRNISKDKKYKRSKNDKNSVGRRLCSDSKLPKSDVNIVNSE